MATTIEIGKHITVGELATLLDLPVSQLIAELFKNGIAVTINENIDFDTAQIIASELKLDVELKPKSEEAPVREARVNEGETRPPVVAMMGHVDHGKTSLLDAIREASVAAKEAGGITQHISAYQIEHNGRLITLLDTPGHESFAALRQHGARLTDVAVIVVAADEGVKPQTLEAIRFAKEADVKILVAANKMDKATDAQLNQLKAQLAENGLAPEGFGGDVVVIPVSAKEKTGIKELLDMILLLADVEELKAPAAGSAAGVVIEAHMESGRGPVISVLVERGTLKTGDFVVAGKAYGKVRNLTSPEGQPKQAAPPANPATVIGLKQLPDFGDEFQVVDSEKAARELASEGANGQTQSNVAGSGAELLKQINRSRELTEFNVVIKADVQGSLTSVVDSLNALSTDEVATKVVGTGVGVITESDLHLALTSGAVIYGFSVNLPPHIKKLAERDQVSIRLFKVIYELLDDVKTELASRLKPEVSEQVLGELSVKGVFRLAKTEAIAGGEVTSGKLSVPSLARIYRTKKLISGELEVTKLQRGPQEVKEVEAGEMCGISFKTETKLDIAEGDRVEVFAREVKTRTL